MVNVMALVPQERGGHTYTPAGGYRLRSNIIDVSMADVGRLSNRARLAHKLAWTGAFDCHHPAARTDPLIHWAKEQSGKNESPGKEDGFEFEEDVYGKIIDR
jgi:hypothetical protein